MIYEIDRIMLYAASSVDYIVKEEPWADLMDKLDGIKNARFDVLENTEGTCQLLAHKATTFDAVCLDDLLMTISQSETDMVA